MNILVIQNRMGIGDMVIFLPFVEAISKKYNTSVTLLIKESTKAREYTNNLNFLKNIKLILSLIKNIFQSLKIKSLNLM